MQEKYAIFFIILLVKVPFLLILKFLLLTIIFEVHLLKDDRDRTFF